MDSTDAISRSRLAAAMRTSWRRATSADPERWSEQNPARGQCDVTSLVVLEYLGGDLQLAEVYLDGEHLEFHYWNQLGEGDALDLTRDQFRDGQVLGEPELVTQELIRSKYPTARAELAERHELLRRAVIGELGRDPPWPLGPSPLGRGRAPASTTDPEQVVRDT